MSLVLQQRPAFKRAYKKLHPNQRDAVHAAMFAQRSARGVASRPMVRSWAGLKIGRKSLP